MTGLSRSMNTRGGIEVAFCDLSRVIEGWRAVDLLKCDIEGAEELVIDNYPDLLRRTRLAIFEFHLDRIDYNQCIAKISACGLCHRTHLQGDKYTKVELFRRIELLDA